MPGYGIIARMKPINTSIFDFPDLIRRGCVYVDKTAALYEIARPDADGIYYLPRPWRSPSFRDAERTLEL